MKPYLIISILMCLSQYSNAKQILVSGFVVDENNNPIENAIVILYGTNPISHLKTDSLGRFQFQCKRYETYRFFVLSEGYESYTKSFVYHFKQLKPFKIVLSKSNSSWHKWENIKDTSKTEILFPNLIYAQTKFDTSKYLIKGTLLEAQFGEPLMFATVVLKQAEKIIAAQTTDFDGNFSFENIPFGTYKIKFSYVGYLTTETKDFVLKEKEQLEIYGLMLQAVSFDDIIMNINIPLIEQDNLTEETIFKSYEIRRSPHKN